MDNKEVEKVLEELYQVRPEKLNDKAKRLFEAIMKIADERDSVKADLYEANNIISEYIDIVKEKDAVIDDMAEQLAGIAIWDNKKEEPLILISKEEVIKYFEEGCK